MTTNSWELWEGADYPAEKPNPSIYYYPDKIDIEDGDHLDDLVNQMHLDGVAPTKPAARAMLESAVVVHGAVQDIDGELYAYFGGYQDYEVTDATWVEVDEYAD